MPKDIATIVGEALEIASLDDRAAYLERECKENVSIRERVDRLLNDYAQAGDFLEQPATVGMIARPLVESVGAMIGPYKLLEQIGEGGFGVVFMAEQLSPIRRKVALKVIKPGMDSKHVVARFEAERQSLALMDDPHIARVLDAGSTESGRPFFVMELVKGIPITDYCDEQRIGTRDRLHLFIDLCRAIQHAHQKGIIHRDIKPSNVLVTQQDGNPLVKVIDFGIAKAIGHQLTDKTLFTGFAQFVGTPLYMSPEQAALSAVDVDTRSDVYSLGVLLYELLTGTLPFDKERLSRASWDEWRRIIREEEPPRPSSRISTLANVRTTSSDRHHGDARKLQESLHGELDWIVLKSLEKDRSRRYESASAFAADIHRYLNDEPVQACPPTWSYRFGKLARRNKTQLTVAAGVIVVLTLMAGGIGMVLGERANRLGQASRTINSDLIQAAQLQRQGKWQEASAVIQGAEKLLANVGGDNAILNRCRLARADLEMLKNLELAALRPADTDFHYPDSVPLFRAAFREYGFPVLEMDREVAAARIAESTIAQDLIAALVTWASITADDSEGKKLMAIAELADNDPMNQEIFSTVSLRSRAGLKQLATRFEVLDLQPYTLRLLSIPVAFILAKLEPDVAIQLLRKAEKYYPSDFWINYFLASALNDLKPAQYEQSLSFYRVALAIRPESAGAYNNLGVSLFHGVADFEGAEHAFREAVRLQPNSNKFRYNLANSLKALRKSAEAMELYRQVIATDPKYAEAYCNLGFVLVRLDRIQEALDFFKKGHELGSHQANWTYDSAQWVREFERRAQLDAALSRMMDKNQMPSSFEEAVALAEYSVGYKRLPAEALRLYEHAFVLMPSLMEVQGNRYNAACAAILLAQDRVTDGLMLTDQVRRVLRKKAHTWLGAELSKMHRQLAEDEPRNLSQILNSLTGWQQDVDLASIRDPNAIAALAEDERSEWQQLWQEVNSLHTILSHRGDALNSWKRFVDDSLASNQRDEFFAFAESLRLEEMKQLAEAYEKMGRWEAAANIMKQLVEDRRNKFGPEHTETIAATKQLGDFYRNAGKWSDSELIYQDLIDRVTAKSGPESRDTLKLELGRAQTLVAIGKNDEGIPLFEQIEKTEREKFGPDDSDRLQAMNLLGYAYYQFGRYEDVERLANELLERRIRTNGPESQPVAITLALLGMNQVSQERFAEAQKTLEQALALTKKINLPAWRQLRLTSLLGVAIAGQGKSAEAEPLLIEGYEGLKQIEKEIPAPWKWFLDASGKNLVEFYESTGSLDKANLWREKISRPSP